MQIRCKLENVETGQAFAIPNDDNVYEYRGNGWYGVYGQSYNGGPWHLPQETVVIVETVPHHPSQTLSAFI